MRLEGEGAGQHSAGLGQAQPGSWLPFRLLGGQGWRWGVGSGPPGGLPRLSVPCGSWSSHPDPEVWLGDGQPGREAPVHKRGHTCSLSPPLPGEGQVPVPPTLILPSRPELLVPGVPAGTGGGGGRPWLPACPLSEDAGGSLLCVWLGEPRGLCWPRGDRSCPSAGCFPIWASATHPPGCRHLRRQQSGPRRAWLGHSSLGHKCPQGWSTQNGGRPTSHPRGRARPTCAHRNSP